eukprot:scaffold13621_cov135-Isochrysis_galbana.AAC.3
MKYTDKEIKRCRGSHRPETHSHAPPLGLLIAPSITLCTIWPLARGVRLRVPSAGGHVRLPDPRRPPIVSVLVFMLPCTLLLDSHFFFFFFFCTTQWQRAPISRHRCLPSCGSRSPSESILRCSAASTASTGGTNWRARGACGSPLSLSAPAPL